MKFNKKKLISILAVGMLFSIVLPNAIKANEEGITTYALTDPAFPDSSKPLEEAIIAKYNGTGGTIKVDTDGDGKISQGEASLWGGTEIVLNSQNLTGTIDGLKYFTNPALVKVSLLDNALEGDITDITYLTKVKTLVLSYNKFNGNIPTNLGDSNQLVNLYLDNNELTGTIPVSIATNCTNLVALYLNNNQLSGSIPPEIGSLTNLQMLYLHSNSLKGSIPQTIGSLSNLKQLQLQNNELTGIIPIELGNMTSLINMNLKSNQLSGSIPSELGNLSSLSALQLGENQLSGEIPSELGNLNNLVQLQLQDNDFKGNIPGEVLDLPNLSILLVQNNGKLEGNLSTDVSLASNLSEINISGTGMIQAPSKNPSLVNFIYDNLAENLLNSDSTLVDGVTQDDIDLAQESANYWNEADKSEWQTNIDLAQELLYQRDAENAVNDLFDTDGTIKDTVLQEDIKDAQDLINKVTDVNKKQELQDKLDEAQRQLEERDFVVLESFETFTGTGTVSTKIDAPVEKFSKVYMDGKLLPSSNYVVTSGSTVITLNEAYLKTLANGTYDVEVEFVSGAKVKTQLTINVVSKNPSTDPSTNKPSTDKPSTDTPVNKKPSIDASNSSTTVSSTVNTGDETNTALYLGMLVSTLTILGFFVKRRNLKSKIN